MKAIGTCIRSFKKGHYASTSGMYGNNFRTVVVIPRSGENEGSMEYPTTTFRTTVGRSSEGDW
jgi:hypothetical protein